uniref:WD_REPEATS_REGION domain-containing protein n=1 Tax=Macrostomum lignano TaxID=282301 RepID=A0A1I8GNU2_9PLAT
ADGEVRLWNLADASAAAVVSAAPSPAVAACWTQCGRQLLLLGRDGRLHALSRESGTGVWSSSPNVVAGLKQPLRAGRLASVLSGRAALVSGFAASNVAARRLALVRLDGLGDGDGEGEPWKQVGECADFTDGGTAPLSLSADPDLHLVTCWSRGDRTLAHLTVGWDCGVAPLLGSEHRDSRVLVAAAWLTKRTVDAVSVEVARGFRLTAEGTLETVSVAVPRVIDQLFQDDLLGRCSVTWQPSLSAGNWMSGSDPSPLLWPSSQTSRDIGSTLGNGPIEPFNRMLRGHLQTAVDSGLSEAADIVRKIGFCDTKVLFCVVLRSYTLTMSADISPDEANAELHRALDFVSKTLSGRLSPLTGQWLGFDSNWEALTAAVYLASSAASPAFLSREARRRSFERDDVWRRRGGRQSPEDMVESGFFYLGEADHVKCFFCDFDLRDWDAGDVPEAEHAKFSPLCFFLKSSRGLDWLRRSSPRPPNYPTSYSRQDHNRLLRILADELRSEAADIVRRVGFSDTKVLLCVARKFIRFRQKFSRQELLLEMQREWDREMSGEPEH